MHLKSTGTVTLCSSKPDDAPLVEPRYLTASGDIEKCKTALELGMDIGNQPGLSQWREKQITPAPATMMIANKGTDIIIRSLE
ncbi:GMC oxidoreductase [Nostoc sp.]|uniref:GMC oxidoreductase n=1 Tax=Nostoc sp. TaxID=1180 RepID=UPI002FFA287E